MMPIAKPLAAVLCALAGAAVAEVVPTAPDGYRRPADWKPNRYPKMLQQIAAESSVEQAARAKKVMAQVDDVNGKGRWKADLESLGKHVCPAWFEDAKLGVFIDWNLYSVASYAREKPDAAFYPDWYCDFMHYDPGESKDAHLGVNGIRSYHEKNWGKDFKRDDFIPLFTGRKFDAGKLCGFLKNCGARYFVPFLKHHDGFCLWDSTWTQRTSVRRGPKRDFAAEMVAACKAQGLKFGFYFSTGEWEYPFLTDDGRVEVRPGGLGAGAPWPVDQEEFETRISGKVAVRDYKREYIIPQAVEFIDRYDPDLVWFDGEWDSPWQSLGSADIAAYLYNRAEGRKEVAVNDRFGLRRTLPAEHTRQEMFENLLRCHCGDFYTDESGDVADQLDPKRHHAWEECTGISKCYGNHWDESEANVMSERAFLEKFTGIVARGGNLLLLVNLDADGCIPKTEELRLRQIGAWLKINGEAIYGTRIIAPFSTPTIDYTQSKDGLTTYAIIKNPAAEVLLDCAVCEGARISILGENKSLRYVRRGGKTVVTLPHVYASRALPFALKIVRNRVGSLDDAAALRLDVRDFGAVGDGVHDDTLPLQRAFDAADRFRRADVASWGDGVAGCTSPEVFLPKGNWRITGSIVATKGITFCGESGSVLDGRGVEGPLLFLDYAYRCTVKGIVFRGGTHHVVFWTGNEDTASILIEGCRFDGAEREAVFTESWSMKVAKGFDLKETTSVGYRGPYDVRRAPDGRAELTRTVYDNRAPGSTRFVMRNCEFRNCGAAYRGGTDGQYFSKLRIRSERKQELPVFRMRSEIELTDIDIVADIPKGYPHAWIDVGSGNVTLSRVKAVSASDYGAPLLGMEIQSREHHRWTMPRSVMVTDCMVSVAGSPSNAFTDFRIREPALFQVKGCREAGGRTVRIFRIGQPPTDLESMRGVCAQGEDLPLELTHRWSFGGNSSELLLDIPEIIRPCLEEPLDDSAFLGFPAKDPNWKNTCSGECMIFCAADYGIGMKRRKTDETLNLERLFAAAHTATNPIVLLPGRTIGISRPIQLPPRVCVRGVGRTIIRGLNESNDLFRVCGKGLSVGFDNVGFVKGDFAICAEGAGRLEVRNGIFGYNRGLRLLRRNAELYAAIIDTTAVSHQLVENDGADVWVRDSWCEFVARPDVPTFVVNRKGTVLMEHVLGVPVTAANPIDLSRMKGLAEDAAVFWIRNEDGVVRTRQFRFGGEFGGIPAVDNYGAGRVLIEGHFASFANKSGPKCFFRNASPEGSVVLNRMNIHGATWSGVHVGRGVRPRNYRAEGLRLLRHAFENENDLK